MARSEVGSLNASVAAGIVLCECTVSAVHEKPTSAFGVVHSARGGCGHTANWKGSQTLLSEVREGNEVLPTVLSICSTTSRVIRSCCAVSEGATQRRPR